MHRILSILLLAAFGLPVVAPLLALAENPEANLPACCRRHGAHHCMMNMQRIPDGTHRVGMLCPSFPQPAANTTGIKLAGLSLAAQLSVTPGGSGQRRHPVRNERPTATPLSQTTRGPPTI